MIAEELKTALDERSINFNFRPFEDYSPTLKQSYSDKLKCMIKEYVGCSNNNLIIEGTFKRLVDKMQNNDFAILSAYRNSFTKEQNIQRNRLLRAALDSKKMGVYQLVGHWLEAPDGVSYADAEQNESTDVIERSYFVVRPDTMNYEEFKNLIIRLLTIDGVTQDCCIIHQNGGGYFCLYPDGNTDKIEDTTTFNKIAQAYSQYVKKMNVPFVFEGVESPSSIGGYRMFSENNILYLTEDKQSSK